jgi:hypothetical protein
MTNSFNPNAVVLVYNYLDRQGDYNLSEGRRDLIELVYLVSDLIEVQTSKSKSQPSGTFSIRLAPTYNWTTKLTPGSWLSIHMTTNYSGDYRDVVRYDSKYLKMIGRIDTVQMQVGVNQETGARETSYVVSGRDWGQVFDSVLYIDPAASISGDSPLSQVMRYGFDKQLAEGEKPYHSTTSLMKFFINLWGVQGKWPEFREKFRTATDGTELSADKLLPVAKFYLPKELASAMNLQDSAGGESNAVANNINLQVGVLTKYDTYGTAGTEVGGFPDLGSVLGGNTMWQIFNAHAGTVVNELLTDFRWDEKRLALTLYKRVKPFLLINDSKIEEHGKKISSSYFNVKRTDINSDLIINVQAGTNWRDKFNFLEILPGITTTIPGWGEVKNLVKAEGSSVADTVSFGRDGFKPLLFTSKAIPFKDDGTPEDDIAKKMVQWLPVMKQWYFNTHKMLNGTITISNQEEYISVGSNISIDGDLFSQSFHVAGDTSRGKKIKLLAHVENVTHSFTVNNEGARNFITTVSFVRGVYTDTNCTKLINGSKSYGIDNDATKLRQNDDEWASNTYRPEPGGDE